MTKKQEAEITALREEIERISEWPVCADCDRARSTIPSERCELLWNVRSCYGMLKAVPRRTATPDTDDEICICPGRPLID